MLKIGITGNIGSGKTTICKIFELLGTETYYADEKAKEFLNYQEVKKKIENIIGSEVFNKTGQIINKKLADIVFNDRDALQNLNSIIHPLVEKDYKQWAGKRKTLPYVLKEAAILFESGFHRNMDKTILVISQTDLMVHRVIKRNNVSEKSVKRRLANQVNQQTKINKADYIIYNDESKLVIPQVLNIHNILCNHQL